MTRTAEKSQKGLYFVAFVMPAAVLLLIYLLAGIEPFGDRLLICEQNSQWFGLLSRYREITAGGMDAMYSFRDGLGGDFYSQFCSSLCSPFLPITAAFPQQSVHLSFVIVMLIKSGCAGVFSYIMLSCVSNGHKTAALPFSIAYSAGSLFYLGFAAPQFTDAAVFLPLVGAGVALLVDRGSVITLFAALILFFVTSGRLWSCCLLFAVVFFAWCALMYADRRKAWARFAMLVVCFIFAAGAATVVLIPPLTANIELGRAVTPVSLIDTVSVPDLITGLFSGGADGSAVMAAVFCSVITLLLIPVYLFNDRHAASERQVGLYFTLFLLAAMVIPPLGWLFAGFSEPGSAVAQFGFVYCAMAAAMATRALVKPEGIKFGSVLCGWGMVLGIFLLAAVIAGESFSSVSLLFTISFLTLFAALVLVAMHKRTASAGFCVMISLCVMCECVLGGMIDFERVSGSLPLYTSGEYAELSGGGLAAELINDRELSGGAGGFFRVRGVRSDRLNCVGSGSVSTSQSAELMRLLGISGDFGYTPVTDALFGIRYAADKNSGYAFIGTAGDVPVWYNQSALGIAYAASEEILSLAEYSVDPMEAQNQLISAIIGTPRELFADATILSRAGQGLSFVETLDGTELTRSEQEGWAEFSVVAPKDGRMYMYFDCDTGAQEAVYANDTLICRRAPGSIVELGSCLRGDTVNVRISVSSERAMLNGVYFASLDEPLTQGTLRELSARQVSYAAQDKNYVRGSVELSPGQVIFTTVPYQSGWHAFADRGGETEISSAAGAFIAISLPAGTHSFELRYTPTGFTLSLILSIIFLIGGFLFVCIAEFRRRSSTVPPPPPDEYMLDFEPVVPAEVMGDQYDEFGGYIETPDYDDYSGGYPGDIPGAAVSDPTSPTEFGISPFGYDEFGSGRQ